MGTVCKPFTKCKKGKEYMDPRNPGTEMRDRRCLKCKACPDGQIKVGGCDGKDKDTICGKVDDFAGSVTTGRNCKVNNVNVGTRFKSNSTWFFKFSDDKNVDVFGAPVGVAKPCPNKNCKVKAFEEQPKLMTADTMPTKAIVTAKGKDGWCISSVCLGSKKWGKFLPLTVENGGECPGVVGERLIRECNILGDAIFKKCT